MFHEIKSETAAKSKCSARAIVDRTAVESVFVRRDLSAPDMTIRVIRAPHTRRRYRLRREKTNSLRNFDNEIEASLASPARCPSTYYKFKFYCIILPYLF